MGTAGNSKLEDDMIAGMQSRVFRPHSVTLGMRQHVVSRTSPVVSRRMARVVAVIVGISLLVVFAFSQVMHHHITSSADRLERLQVERSEFMGRNIELLAARAQLASQEFVEKRAAEKLKLFVPQKSQVRRL
ncbi:MAG: hypothetical protein Kow0089_00200 [Desulfobulbaceae bacterium]